MADGQVRFCRGNTHVQKSPYNSLPPFKNKKRKKKKNRPTRLPDEVPRRCISHIDLSARCIRARVRGAWARRRKVPRKLSIREGRAAGKTQAPRALGNRAGICTGRTDGGDDGWAASLPYFRVAFSPRGAREAAARARHFDRRRGAVTGCVHEAMRPSRRCQLLRSIY